MTSERASFRPSHLLLGVTCLLLAGATAPSFAQVPSYSVTGWDYEGAAAGQVGPYTLGYNFTPTENIVVSALGEWVPAGNTINASETIGIFDSTGNLLFSSPWTQANALLTGNVLPSGSEFQYVDITSAFSSATRTLTAGDSYTVAGTVGNNTYSTSAQGLTAASDITITSDGLYNNGDTVSIPSPTPPIQDAGYNMYGINFESNAAGSPTNTPEPGVLTLFAGMAMTCGTLALRRRKVAVKA